MEVRGKVVAGFTTAEEEATPPMSVPGREEVDGAAVAATINVAAAVAATVLLSSSIREGATTTGICSPVLDIGAVPTSWGRLS